MSTTENENAGTGTTKSKTVTTYIVLVADNESGNWRHHGNVDAASADAAVRHLADEEGQYVAVPVRSFQPVKVKVETERKVRLA